MNTIKIIIFIISIEKILLISDYCTSRSNPEEPNQCVFLSNSTTKCCFNPNDKTQCFWQSEEIEGLKCDADYFYDKYEIGEEYYKKHKNEKGYCTFIYGDLKGAFKYDITIEEELKINEINGLIINCLSYQDMLKMKLFGFIIFFILVY